MEGSRKQTNISQPREPEFWPKQGTQSPPISVGASGACSYRAWQRPRAEHPHLLPYHKESTLLLATTLQEQRPSSPSPSYPWRIGLKQTSQYHNPSSTCSRLAKQEGMVRKRYSDEERFLIRAASELCLVPFSHILCLGVPTSTGCHCFPAINTFIANSVLTLTYWFLQAEAAFSRRNSLKQWMQCMLWPRCYQDGRANKPQLSPWCPAAVPMMSCRWSLYGWRHCLQTWRQPPRQIHGCKVNTSE